MASQLKMIFFGLSCVAIRPGSGLMWKCHTTSWSRGGHASCSIFPLEQGVVGSVWGHTTVRTLGHRVRGAWAPHNEEVLYVWTLSFQTVTWERKTRSLILFKSFYFCLCHSGRICVLTDESPAVFGLCSFQNEFHLEVQALTIVHPTATFSFHFQIPVRRNLVKCGSSICKGRGFGGWSGKGGRSCRAESCPMQTLSVLQVVEYGCITVGMPETLRRNAYIQ